MEKRMEILLKKNICIIKKGTTEEIRKKLRYQWDSFIGVKSHDLHEYLFITLKDMETLSVEISYFSNYFFKSKTGLLNRAMGTKENHARVIVLFLNYLFLDNGGQIVDLRDLGVEHGNKFLNLYGQGKIGRKHKRAISVEISDYILTHFYRFIVMGNNIKFKYLKKSDFKYNQKYIDLNGTKKKMEVLMSIFDEVEYPQDAGKRSKVETLSTYGLAHLLDLADEVYPEIKLAIAMQSFAGLRRGEVCQTTLDRITFSQSGLSFDWFCIDLNKEKILRDDGKVTGRIKKHRDQAVHPIFMKLFSSFYREHLQCLKGKGFDSKNKFGALFLNREGKAMMVQSYNQKFKRLEILLLERLRILASKGDVRATSQLDILIAAPLTEHSLRYFYSQYITPYVSSPYELAYWRGDSSLKSAITYIKNNPMLVDEKLKNLQDGLLSEIGVN